LSSFAAGGGSAFAFALALALALAFAFAFAFLVVIPSVARNLLLFLPCFWPLRPEVALGFSVIPSRMRNLLFPKIPVKPSTANSQQRRGPNRGLKSCSDPYN
jgi:hypothetical protein